MGLLWGRLVLGVCAEVGGVIPLSTVLSLLRPAPGPTPASFAGAPAARGSAFSGSAAAGGWAQSRLLSPESATLQSYRACPALLVAVDPATMRELCAAPC